MKLVEHLYKIRNKVILKHSEYNYNILNKMSQKYTTVYSNAYLCISFFKYIHRKAQTYQSIFSKFECKRKRLTQTLLGTEIGVNSETQFMIYNAIFIGYSLSHFSYKYLYTCQLCREKQIHDDIVHNRRLK